MKKFETISEDNRSAFLLAFWVSVIITAMGVLYGIVIFVSALNGQMKLPPPEPLQLFGGVTTMLAAVLLPVLFGAVHCLVPQKKKVFTFLGASFGLIFAVFVGINRFVQLSVVRLSVLEGNTDGLSRFLPYEPRSMMFALEIAGWGLFLSLALFFLAFAFGRRDLPGAIRMVFFCYTALGLVSAVAFVLNSPLSAIGFAAWGLLLYLGTGMLAVSLRKHGVVTFE